jgi:flagellar biosynthesis protein FlhB
VNEGGGNVSRSCEFWLFVVCVCTFLNSRLIRLAGWCFADGMVVIAHAFELLTTKNACDQSSSFIIIIIIIIIIFFFFSPLILFFVCCDTFHASISLFF